VRNKSGRAAENEVSFLSHFLYLNTYDTRAHSDGGCRYSADDKDQSNFSTEVTICLKKPTDKETKEE
jgi:hypothetical protein